jgi:thioredoxin reductase (NADPH)
MTDLLVVGAGPAGLSCAIEAVRAKLRCVILDQGNVADAIRRFPVNMVWFSTPELLEIGDVPFTVTTVRPTRADTLRYYQTVAVRFGLDVRPHDAVTGIRREGEGFLVSTAGGGSFLARNVVVATGYFDRPARLGVPGEAGPRVLHYYTEPFAYRGCRVTVVGGRNSAVEAALDLYRNGAKVTLVHRGEQVSPGVKYWILPDLENRLKAGQIAARFRSAVREIRDEAVVVDGPEGAGEIPTDFTFVLIGFLPDAEFLKAQQIPLDPQTLAPFHDPETMETPVRGLYVAGSVAAGRETNKIFVENGRLHGAKIVRAILSSPPPAR